MRAKVTDHPDLVRDLTTGAVINGNRTALQSARAKKKAQLVTSTKIRDHDRKIEKIEQQLNRIEAMLSTLLSNNIGNSPNG